ncbi:MAG: thioesterase family protein [Acidobacteriota bacterium]
MASFNFSIPMEVRFRDLDALGHVNNAVYLTYFEVVRTHYWRHLFDLRSYEDFNFLVVRIECNFRSPAMFGETLRIAAAVRELKNSSFVFEYEVTDQETGRLIADGLSVQACFDKQEKRSVPIPNEMRSKIKQFEGLP